MFEQSLKEFAELVSQIFGEVSLSETNVFQGREDYEISMLVFPTSAQGEGRSVQVNFIYYFLFNRELNTVQYQYKVVVQ